MAEFSTLPVTFPTHQQAGSRHWAAGPLPSLCMLPAFMLHCLRFPVSFSDCFSILAGEQSCSPATWLLNCTLNSHHSGKDSSLTPPAASAERLKDWGRGNANLPSKHNFSEGFFSPVGVKANVWGGLKPSPGSYVWCVLVWPRFVQPSGMCFIHPTC